MEREWNKIYTFLLQEYGDAEFEMERGLKYLEQKYNLVSRYNDGTLSQQRVQLLRVVHMLEDYRLHQVLTRRCYATKIHMPNISKSAKLPSSWQEDELKAMLVVIDRNNPIGKRDYAMILLACVLGLRISDIKNLRFSNLEYTYFPDNTLRF